MEEKEEEEEESEWKRMWDGKLTATHTLANRGAGKEFIPKKLF